MHLLKDKNLMIWLIGCFQSNLGSVLSAIALSFLVFTNTQSVAAVSSVLAAELAPSIFRPFFGVVADKLPIKPLLIICDMVRAAIIGILGLVLIKQPFDLPYIVLAAFAIGVCDALYQPAAAKYIPSFVAAKDLVKINSVYSTSNDISRTLGFVGGGFLISVIEKEYVLIFDAASFFVMAILLFLVKIPETQTITTHPLQMLKDGWLSFRKSQLMIYIAATAFAINGYLSLLQAVLPKLIFQYGFTVSSYSYIMASTIVGMIVGGVTLSNIKTNDRESRYISFSLFILAFSLIAFNYTKNIYFICFAATILGINISMIGILTQSMMQRSALKEQLGRISGIVGFFAGISPPITLLVMSFWADSIKLQFLLIGFGVASCVLAIMWLKFSFNRQKNVLVEAT